MKNGYFARLLKPLDRFYIAQMMAVDPSNVWRWQKGRALPRRSALQSLAVASLIPLQRLVEAYDADKAKRERRR